MVFVFCHTNIVFVHGFYRTLRIVSALQGQQLGRLANEAGQALLIPPGSAEEVGQLRAFVERVRRSCRRLAYKMSCMTTPDVELAHGGPSSESSAGHTGASTQQQTPMHYGTRTRTRSTSVARTQSRSMTGAASTSVGTAARGKAPWEQTSESEEQSSDDGDPSYGVDVMGTSQLAGAPPATQLTQPPRRHRDRTNIASGNVLPSNTARERRKKKPYTPGM
ncbi:uncharacterized protein LOC133908288 [Phragmites australis]|uniref:uncharacterized protein LOC133908288 n=1 Tax=Phragmites australis TaxID=29695 RepID=UPI002D79F02F|nr:uncharacterized protein LOC133908288 [Phragmites australis]